MSAFESLVSRHEDKVYGLALRMTRSEADAAEITQDTFLSAYQHLNEFRGEAAFGSWVHRIAANNALMRLRRQKVLDSGSEELSRPGVHRAGEPRRDARVGLEQAGRRQGPRRRAGAGHPAATDALPEGYREVFLLKDVEGLVLRGDLGDDGDFRTRGEEPAAPGAPGAPRGDRRVLQRSVKPGPRPEHHWRPTPVTHVQLQGLHRRSCCAFLDGEMSPEEEEHLRRAPQRLPSLRGVRPDLPSHLRAVPEGAGRSRCRPRSPAA